jgi:predicted nucleic acid-binding protein
VPQCSADFWERTVERIFLDSAYIAKFYVNEGDSRAVRELIRGADSLVSTAWAMGEVSRVLHRHMREGKLTERQLRELLDAFIYSPCRPKSLDVLAGDVSNASKGRIACAIGAGERLSAGGRRRPSGGGDGCGATRDLDQRSSPACRRRNISDFPDVRFSMCSLRRL